MNLVRKNAFAVWLLLSIALAPVPSPAILSRDKQIRHALDRLTFGPRPGDIEQVAATGLRKWIDLQLHPKKIAENPVLEAKLKYLGTLSMSPAEMLSAYPTPQVIQALARGKGTYPADPEKRRLAERLVDQYRLKRRQAGGPEAPVRETPKLLVH